MSVTSSVAGHDREDPPWLAALRASRACITCLVWQAGVKLDAGSGCQNVAGAHAVGQAHGLASYILLASPASVKLGPDQHCAPGLCRLPLVTAIATRALPASPDPFSEHSIT